MVLHISQVEYQQIAAALIAAYPDEGCGLLVGRRVFAPSSTLESQPLEIYREVIRVIPVANAWEPSLLDYTDAVGETADRQSHGARDRYWIDPADLLRVQKESRLQDLEIIGIYHSHPDHPALPSECDRRLAWPVYSYLIASVRGGTVADVTSWQLNAVEQFEPEAIKILSTSTNKPPFLS